MTKTNTATATATRSAKKVLSEQDIIGPKGETQAAMKKRFARELAAEAKAEGTIRAASLARGVDSRAAPHSSKAVSDSKAKASNKADAKAAKGKAKADAKVASKAKADAKKADRAGKRDLPIKLLVKPADTTLKGGRLAKLEAVAKAKPKTVADILGKTVIDATGKEHLLDMGAINGMVKRGHIALG